MRRLRPSKRTRNPLSPDPNEGVFGPAATAAHAAPASPVECRPGGEAQRALHPSDRQETGPRQGHRAQVRCRLQPAGQPRLAAPTIDQRTRGTDRIAGHLTLTFSLDVDTARMTNSGSQRPPQRYSFHPALTSRIRQLRDEEDSLIARSLGSRSQVMGHAVSVIETSEALHHLKDLRELLNDGTPIQQKEFLASFVRRITKTGDSVKIEYSLPVPPDLSSLSDERVPRIDLSGGPGKTRTSDLYFIRVAL